MNGVVRSHTVKVAGNAIDRSIIKYMQNKYKLLIGERTAERVKIELCNLYDPSDEVTYIVKGRSLLKGLPAQVLLTVKDILSDIFLGTGWPHMWYIYLMLAIYLLLPFYKLIADHAGASQIKYLILLYAVFLSVIPFIETASGKKLPFYICVFSIYPFYLFLGHAMHTGIIKLPKNACGIMFLICAGVTAMLTVYAFSADKSSVGAARTISLLSVYSFPVYAAASVGAFGYIRKTRNKPVPVFDTIAAELDNCSFGIYLIHMAVLKFIFAVIKLDPFKHGGTITVILLCIVTLVISYGITKLLKIVPCVKKII